MSSLQGGAIAVLLVIARELEDQLVHHVGLPGPGSSEAEQYSPLEGVEQSQDNERQLPVGEVRIQ